MICFPNAKINLGLYITEKRVDGFHSIISCLYPISWCDVLEIVSSDSLNFTTSGLPIPGDAATNLCIRAYNCLKKDFDIPPVHIHLHKIIPMGAGLGGGSSDAAYTLNTLNTLFSLGLAVEELQTYASTLGSDCAFFVENIPMIATQKGDILTPSTLSLSGMYAVVAYPMVHMPTAEAYNSIVPSAYQGNFEELLSNPVKWKTQLINNFENAVVSRYSVVGDIKKELYSSGAFYASMTGSGSSVYGLFHQKPVLSDNFKKLYTVWEEQLK